MRRDDEQLRCARLAGKRIAGIEELPVRSPSAQQLRCWVVGHPERHSPFRRNGVKILVSVVIARERDRFTVWTEPWKCGRSGWTGDRSCQSPFSRNYPDAV